MKIKELSIIFPIYNEDNRLQKNLINVLKMIKSFKSFNIEIIFVNDGSTDNSHKIINEFIKVVKKKHFSKFIYIYYKNNMGKGFALKKGIQKAKKKWILTCDIDFSANPTEIIKWNKFNYIENEKLCYFGSRKLKNSIVKCKNYRKFAGFIFNSIVYLLFRLEVTDTQCGFKLYSKNYAKKIFNQIKEFLKLVKILN